MTPQQIEAMKLAIEALKWCHGGEPCGTAEAITALEEALAQPEQEPVAWMSSGEARMIHWKSKHPGFGDDWIPLYTIPPHRKPLTDEVISALWSWSQSSQAEATANTQQHAFARSIEAAHGIKE